MLRILKNPFELVKFRYTKIMLKVVIMTVAQSILLRCMSDQAHSKDYEALVYCYNNSTKYINNYEEA